MWYRILCFYLRIFYLYFPNNTTIYKFCMDFYSVVLHILLSNSNIDRYNVGPKKDRKKDGELSSQEWVKTYFPYLHTTRKVKDNINIRKMYIKQTDVNENCVKILILTSMHYLVLFCELFVSVRTWIAIRI